jgi:toxin ParE1/3/4
VNRLERSNQAIEDLAVVWYHIAQDDLEAADRFADRLEEVCRKLAQSPFLGRLRPELSEGIRSFPVGNYLVFYRPLVDGIAVARVLSGFRDIGPDSFEPSDGPPSPAAP